jgi:hypothetical protein
LPGSTEKNHEKPQDSRYLGQDLTPGPASQKDSRSVTHSVSGYQFLNHGILCYQTLIFAFHHNAYCGELFVMNFITLVLFRFMANFLAVNYSKTSLSWTLAVALKCIQLTEVSKIERGKGKNHPFRLWCNGNAVYLLT